MKMIYVEAKPFDAWTPSFADYHKASSEVSGAIERPPIPHRIELAGNFFLSEFPVTNKMYRLFVRETGYREPGGELLDIDRVKTGRGFSGIILVSEGVESWELEAFSADDQPVAGVNYMDAVAFCEWLSKKEGRTFRLPEVYEWEYACRAGTDTLFWWGDRADPRSMNYAASRIGHPSPVGMYPPNPWGLYDVHGNVAECCQQIGRPGGVQKGGAWNYPAGLLGADVYVDVRGTFNPHMPITRRTLSTGFRVACDAESKAASRRVLDTLPISPTVGGGPRIPELEIRVGERLDLRVVRAQGAVQFTTTQAGSWIVNHKRSTDRGQSWHECMPLGEACCQLRDGTIVTVRGPDSGGERASIEDPFEIETSVEVVTSHDDWRSGETFQAPVRIPFGKTFWPVRGLIELDDGNLLMTMYGWNQGDQIRESNPMFPIEDQAYKTRVIAVCSTDRGRSWSYHSTVCAHPEMGREGANESTLVKLPTGDLFAPLRTGLHGYSDRLGREDLDEPLLVCWSRCGGKSWSEPERIYVNDKLVTGIYPGAVVTESGVLALLRTRPDGSVIFSPDGSGTIWTDEVGYYCAEKRDKYPGSMHQIARTDPDTVMVVCLLAPESGRIRRPDGFFEYRAVGIPITVHKAE